MSTLSAKMFPYENPSPETVAKFHLEYGMTPESIKQDVATLKEWMQKQPHLPNIEDDRVFERFLYFCKNSMEKTKAKLDMYYTTRAANPDYFYERDPTNPIIKESTQTMYFCVLPKLTKEGDRVTVFKIFDSDVNKFNPTVVFKTGFMMIDAHLPEDLCRSHVLVYDMQGGSIGHVGSLTIPVLRKFFNSGLVGMPTRHSSFHIVNAPSFAESLITLSKSLMKDKLAKRVHVHSDVTGLHAYIPKENLPAEYGGTYSKTMNEIRDISYAALLEHKQWFANEEKLVADETKRLAKNNTLDQGIEGSFRKINID